MYDVIKGCMKFIIIHFYKEFICAWIAQSAEKWLTANLQETLVQCETYFWRGGKIYLDNYQFSLVVAIHTI